MSAAGEEPMETDSAPTQISNSSEQVEEENTAPDPPSKPDQENVIVEKPDAEDASLSIEPMDIPIQGTDAVEKAPENSESESKIEPDEKEVNVQQQHPENVEIKTDQDDTKTESESKIDIEQQKKSEEVIENKDQMKQEEVIENNDKAQEETKSNVDTKLFPENNESSTQTSNDVLPTSGGANGDSTFVTQIVDKDLSALENDLKNGPSPANLKIASFADNFSGGDNCQSDPKQKPFACSQCYEDTEGSSKALVWEMIVFCNDNCLSKKKFIFHTDKKMLTLKST